MILTFCLFVCFICTVKYNFDVKSCTCCWEKEFFSLKTYTRKSFSKRKKNLFLKRWFKKNNLFSSVSFSLVLYFLNYVSIQKGIAYEKNVFCFVTTTELLLNRRFCQCSTDELFLIVTKRENALKSHRYRFLRFVEYFDQVYR